MDFMKNLWGSMPSAVPGFVVPTVDLGELDKRIEDLRAVESWLALNANMLKATIQGLEVQRNTIAALHALRDKGDLLHTAMQTGLGAGRQAAGGTPLASPSASAFEQLFGGTSTHANWPLTTPSADEAVPKPDEPPVQLGEPGGPAEPRKAARQGHKKQRKTTARAGKASPAVVSNGGSTAAVQSANMWMNFLKDQFSQIAGAALAPAAGAGSAPAHSDAPQSGPAHKTARPKAKARRPAVKKAARKRAAARTLAR
jgi:hypothetical protein